MALLAPVGAVAKGGDKTPTPPKSTPDPAPALAPAPAPAPQVSCDSDVYRTTADGASTFQDDVQFSGPDDSAGCLELAYDDVRVTFVSMELNPGFSYKRLTDSHVPNGVVVRFTRDRNRERREWRIEPGKTVIK